MAKEMCSRITYLPSGWSSIHPVGCQYLSLYPYQEGGWCCREGGETYLEVSLLSAPFSVLGARKPREMQRPEETQIEVPR